MKTVTEQLADALRAVLPFAERDVGELLDLVRDDDSEAEADTASESIWAARNALSAYDAQQAETAVTWSPSMNRWRDQTGTAHAYMPDSADPVCGARPYSSGGHYTKAEDSGAHACRRCKRALAAAGVADGRHR